MRSLGALTLSLVAACGADGADELPSPPPGEACGVETGAPVGTECASFLDCGGDNLTTTFACAICPEQAAFRVCESGGCRPMDRTGSIRALVEAPPTADGAGSIVATAYLPEMADGRRMTCAALLEPTCQLLGAPRTNPVNANILEPPDGVAFGLSYFVAISTDVGEDRLILVQITDRADGEGEVVARGCAEGLSVRSGERTDALVPMSAP